MRWTLNASGPAAPATVWEAYVRPSRWSSWSPQISRVDCADVRLRAGSKGVVHPILGPGLDFEVIELDEPARSWSWRVRLPLGLEMLLHHEVHAADAGVRTSLTVEGFLPVVLGYLPLAQLALSRLVRIREPD